MSEETETKPRRGRPPKNQPPPNTSLENDPKWNADLEKYKSGRIFETPHHPPITANGFRDEALKQWLLDYYPDLANLALTGRITNHTQP